MSDNAFAKRSVFRWLRRVLNTRNPGGASGGTFQRHHILPVGVFAAGDGQHIIFEKLAATDLDDEFRAIFDPFAEQSNGLILSSSCRISIAS